MYENIVCPVLVSPALLVMTGCGQVRDFQVNRQ